MFFKERLLLLVIAKSTVRVKNIFILLGGISLIILGIGFAIAEALLSWLVLYLLASNLEGMDDLRANLIIVPVLLICLCSVLAGFCIFGVPGIMILSGCLKVDKTQRVVLPWILMALMPAMIYLLAN